MIFYRFGELLSLLANDSSDNVRCTVAGRETVLPRSFKKTKSEYELTCTYDFGNERVDTVGSIGEVKNDPDHEI